MKTLDRKGIKVGAILCILCMVFTLLAGTQTAYAQGTAEIVAISSEVEKGGVVKISLNLSNNPGIWGLKFKVGYNHDAMTLKSATVGDVFAKSEVTLPESLDKEQFVFYASGDELKNNSKNGTLIVLEFQINNAAAASDYSITLELTQAINVDGDDVAVNMTNGKVTVVDCLHSTKEWKLTQAATCEATGTETETCTKCGKTFSTREIKATGHQNTEVKNAVSATEDAEGYTGDTCCKVCGKVISKGEVIPKLEKETSTTPSQPSQPSKPSKPSKPQTEPETEEEVETESEIETEEPVTETEEPTEEPEETEEPADTEEPEQTEEPVDAEESSSPWGMIAGITLTLAAVAALGFVYIKHIRKGR